MCASRSLGKVTISCVVWACLIAGLVASGAPGACLAGASGSGEAEATRLNLATCCQQALEHNPSYRASVLDLEHSELSAKKAEADNAVMASAVSLKQATLAAAAAKRSLESGRRKLMLDVKTAYFTALQAEAQEAISRQSLDYVTEQLRIARLKFKEGMATKLDVMSAELSVDQARVSLESATRTQQLAMLRLIQTVGLPPETQVTLDASEFELSPWTRSEQDIMGLVGSILEVKQAADSLEVARTQAASSDNDYTAPLVRAMTANRCQAAELTLQNVTSTALYNVKTMLSDLATAESGVKLAQKQVEVATEKHRVTELRYNAGLEIPNAVMAAYLDLVKARQDEVKKKCDCHLARVRLTNYLGIEEAEQ